MTDGQLALVFDDGYVEDDEQIRPVLESREVPASLAITPEWLGTDGHLDADRLGDLADQGWEVVAHGRKHRYLQAHHLARDVADGDELVVLESGHVYPGEDHGVYPGDEFEVTDGTRRETGVVAEKADGDARKPWLSFEEPFSASFSVDETVVRPTEATIRDEVGGAKRDLASLGFEPTTFALPYDAGDPRAWAAVAENYDALADAAVRSLPNPPGRSPLSLQRYYLETSHMRLVEIETYLDAVAERGGLGILAGHSAWDTVPPERVGAVVDAALDRDVEVTTVRDATAP